jgi:acyl-CoA synthetase (AMP-forming)/AMP-acid ligase II
VATQPNAIASRSSRRVVTYRKFWSRIERGTARLKGEWGIKQGDTVIYWGQGHQDALMLYMATARCGARLLALEHTSLQQGSAALLKKYPAAILLHDDGITFDTPPAVPQLVNLSSLIATRCHHAPLVEEDPTLVSLIEPETGIGMTAQDLLLQASEISVVAQSRFHVEAALFDIDIFAPAVLPVLIGGGTIVFR